MKVFFYFIVKLHLFLLLIACIVIKTVGSLEDFLTLLNGIPEDGLEGRNI